MKILENLADTYRDKIRPSEKQYSFAQFQTSMNRIGFLAKPMALSFGEYSVGKTSFIIIEYLVARDFPGISMRPEPTTDSFLLGFHVFFLFERR